MKILLISLFAFFFQNDIEKEIQFIRNQYSLINEFTKNSNPKKIDVFDESTEGGELKAYFGLEGEVRKIEMTYYGETGKLCEEYYFFDGSLIFAFMQRHEYNRPIYWNKDYAEKNADSEYFDPEKTQIDEDRFYFKGDNMIRWINSDHDIVKKENQEFDQWSEKVLKESMRLIEKLD